MSRREQLEEMLKSEPGDQFLRYALALEHLSEGNVTSGLAGLEQLIDDAPDYVAAYFQMGQVLAGQDDSETAKDILKRGIDAARKIGDSHAEGEMAEFLGSL